MCFVAPLALAVVATFPEGAVQDVDLQRELATLVDLGKESARKTAAAKLAKRREISIEAWLEAMREFGTFEPRAGHFIETVMLEADGKLESTELHVYVPPSYEPSTPAPLMLMFHGTGGNGRGMTQYWRGVADPLRMIVVAPSEAGPNEGYASTQRERDSALSALRWIRRTCNIDESRIFAAGISRGGHLAWDLALRHPDRFAAIAPMIGGPRFDLRRGANNIRYLENVVDLPIRDLQGSRDDPGLLFNLRYAFQRLDEWGAKDAKLIEFEGLGHSFEFGAVDWNAFLSNASRDPRPARVIRATARPDEGRSFWIEVQGTDKRKVKEVFTPKISAQLNGKLDDAGKRRFLIEAADEKTARMDLTRIGRGAFEGSGKHVTRFRILLTEEMFDPARAVEVTFDGKKTKRKVKPSRLVLLEEFAERFDRSFLPVAEVLVKP